MGQCKRKLGVCNFFQVFKFNSFWIQDSALYKTALTHPKLDSVSESYKALNFLLAIHFNGKHYFLLVVLEFSQNPT